MKKIAMLLAMLTVATCVLAACGEDTVTETTTEAAQTTPKAPSTTTVMKPPVIIDPSTTEEDPAPEPLDSSNFKLDGDLSEYAGLHTISVIGEKAAANEEKDYTHKKVTFYGAFTTTGLYLACEAYHDIYTAHKDGEWWTNTNFEFFIGAGNAQKYVYARGLDQECKTSGSDVTAIMVTEELADGPTNYRTITEVFVPLDYLNESDIFNNSMDVGVAWKTIGDVIIGGAGTVGPDKEDEYWVPKGTWPNGVKPIIDPKGIWLPDEYVA